MPRRPDPEKRERILVAAREAFLEHGYGGARMTGIAGSAGMAVGTIYLYFPSKEDLAVSLEEILFDHISSEILPLLSGIHTSEGIEKIVETTLRIMVEDADILRVRNTVPGRLSVIRERCVEIISEGLAEQMEAGRIRAYDPRILVDLVIVMVEQAIQRSCIQEVAEIEDYQEVVIRMIQSILLK